MSKKVIIGSNVGYEILKYDIKSKIFNYLVESVSKSKLESNLIKNECNLNDLMDNNYNILPNIVGEDYIFICKKLNDKYYVVLVEKNSFDLNNINFNKINIISLKIRLNLKSYDGTIFEGRLVNLGGTNVFIINKVFMLDGSRLDNLALDDIYEKTNEFIDNSYILDTNMNSILFKLNRVYKIYEFDDLLSNKLKSSKYKFSSIDFVKSNFENTYRLYFSNQDYSSNFVNILGKLIDIDVIELYAKDNMNKIRRIGIAHIPDINTSLLCNKFISKNELSNLRCKFNFKFKKWVPLKVINEKYFECAKYEDINKYMCNIIGN
jgi:hypothetical protein